jgi:hypothetical protein
VRTADRANENVARIVLRSGDTAAGDLPDGWSRAVLRELGTIQAGPSNQVVKRLLTNHR